MSGHRKRQRALPRRKAAIVRLREDPAMRAVYNNRRANVRAIASSYSTIVAFSAAIERAPCVYWMTCGHYLHNGEVPRRDIGESLARHIERRLNLPPHSLDEAPLV